MGLILDVLGTFAIFPGAGFAELIAQGGEIGEVAMEEAAAGDGVGDGIEDQNGPGSTCVQDGPVDLAGLPEAGVGGVVFEAGEEGDGGADHGDGEPGEG